MKISIGVVGGGSWGTALSKHLAEKGHDIAFWVREDEVRESIERDRENVLYLPGITLPPNIFPTTTLSDAVRDKDLVVFSVPSQFVRGVLEEGAAGIGGNTVLVNTSKGIELNTGKLISQVFSEVLSAGVSSRFAALSGPSFALEVAERKPTAVSLASESIETARFAQGVFSNQYFRAYAAQDVVGVEIGGAMKNVIAIAAGIVDGLGLGHNSKAALITRGLAETARLGVKMGADPMTFAGLAGVGDLVLTCTGGLSRNRKVGVEIGKGRGLEDILSEMRMVAEGVKTSLAALDLSKSVGVEIPITEQVVSVLYDGKSPQKAIFDLMTRELRREMD